MTRGLVFLFILGLSTLAPSGKCIATPLAAESFTGTYGKKAGLKDEDARRELERVFGAVSGALKAGESVVIPGFGKFSVQSRKAIKAAKASSAADTSSRAQRSVRFTIAPELRASLNVQP